MNETIFKGRVSRRTFIKYSALTSASLMSSGTSQAQEGAGAMNEESRAILTTIDALAQASMSDGLVPGMAVVVVRDRQILLTKGYGYADLQHHLPFTERTSIQIGSTSKSMTGFAVAQLLERKFLSLGETVKHYLPYFKVDHPKSADITVRQLLAQTSGLPSTDWVYERTVVNDEAKALETLVRSLADIKLRGEPGSSYEYSNYNYAVLGLLVQQVSGLSYEDYMRGQVFEPLGMTRTVAPANKDELSSNLELSRGYLAGSQQKNIERPVVMARQWNTSGLIISNARDIANYLVAQLQGGQSVTGAQVLGKETLELSHQGLAEAESTLGGPTQYAFGWETTTREGVRVIEHGGDGRTSGSYFLLLPDQGIGVAVLLNLVDYGKVQLTYQIAKTLLGQEVEPYQALPKPEAVPASTFRPDPKLWQNYLGEYDTVRGRLEVFVEDSQLKLRLAKGSSVEELVTLEAQSEHEFITRSDIQEAEGLRFELRHTDIGPELSYEGKTYQAVTN